MAHGGDDVGAALRESGYLRNARVDRSLAYRNASFLAVVPHLDAHQVAAQARVEVRLTTVGMVERRPLASCS